MPTEANAAEVSAVPSQSSFSPATAHAEAAASYLYTRKNGSVRWPDTVDASAGPTPRTITLSGGPPAITNPAIKISPSVPT
ncbi:MAG: hypothetical protein BWX86_01347 [Verrucomicrobia bacterium ADurb.Bin122]|nr:MAG: hypothetical protein BWX86_01347 [Verrucomicrobia bacterium ADurb.Bin122]